MRAHTGYEYDVYSGGNHAALTARSGISGYQYDPNGNLTQKTEARGTVTSYSYDDLNRVTNRNYSLAGSTTATPNVSYIYGSTPSSCGIYSKGRLCSVSSTASTTNYSYGHARGLVTQSSQTTAGPTYTVNNYTYNRADALISQTYPSGRIVHITRDGAGRVASVQRQGAGYYAGDGTNPIQYSSHGAIQQLKLGNGLWDEIRFN
ncbi:MAG: RHS repeat domain-containing protein, partial [Pyrinomonadaceae bacterium]